jgi:uncharacterized C2H2 Zn-finger protein
MLYIICSAIIAVMCIVGIVTKAENLKRYFLIGILVVSLIPIGVYTISHIADSSDSTKYFKCTRCGEIRTATKDEYQYDANTKTYYLMHDCPRYVPDIQMKEVSKKDALEELRLKQNK